MSAGDPPKQSNMSVFGSPVLVGAVTVLVTLVAVFLAYGANNGLPFVPYRVIKIDLPNGDELVKGNDVREGGYRVGFVTKMDPVRLPDGSVGAQVTASLVKTAGSFPVDSTAIVRTQTAIGEQYLELDRGSSRQVIADGGTLPVGNVQVQPEFDQVLSTFDAPTRVASQVNLNEFGAGLAGRGPDLSETISVLPQTFSYLTPVATNLASPQTNIHNFFAQLDRTAATIAPVSPAFSHLFTTMANTFAAIDHSPPALKSTIVQTPPTLAVGIRSFAVQIPFLNATSTFAKYLSPAAVALHQALPTLNQALVVGTAVTKRSPILYKNLQGTSNALKSLAEAPLTDAALRGLTDTVNSVQPQLRFLGPYITVCNDWTTFWTFAAESQSAPSPGGQALRVLGNTTNNAANSMSSQGAATPANGETNGSPGQPAEFLHAQPYGAAVTNSGQADCEYGQRGYTKRSTTGAPAGYNVVNAPHNEVGYAAGPTYQYYDKNGPHGLGPTHVPPGETFTREPGGNGAQIQSNLAGEPMRGKRRGGLSTVAVGAIVLVAAVIITFFGFTKKIPFRHQFTVKAAFANAVNIAKGSPVRIAGVNVGKVVRLSSEPGSTTASLVTMQIQSMGLPIHRDATLEIRPRTFLEGNFFVQIDPGSPSAPLVKDGDTIPVAQTAAPVQLDQVLSVLNTSTRTQLQGLLRDLSTGLSGPGAAGYNQSIPFQGPAFRDNSVVNNALLGQDQHDLSGYIKSSGAVAEATDADPNALENLVSDFDTTAGALAAQDTALAQSIHDLPALLTVGKPSLAAVDQALPSVNAFATALLPGTRNSPARDQQLDPPAAAVALPRLQARAAGARARPRAHRHLAQPPQHRLGAAAAADAGGLELSEHRGPALVAQHAQRLERSRPPGRSTRRR